MINLYFFVVTFMYVYFLVNSWKRSKMLWVLVWSLLIVYNIYIWTGAYQL